MLPCLPFRRVRSYPAGATTRFLTVLVVFTACHTHGPGSGYYPAVLLPWFVAITAAPVTRLPPATLRTVRFPPVRITGSSVRRPRRRVMQPVWLPTLPVTFADCSCCSPDSTACLATCIRGHTGIARTCYTRLYYLFWTTSLTQHTAAG